MIVEGKVTVRNVSLLLLQRGIQAASGFAFALLVPRWMGPDIYGRYSLISSISIWFILFSHLGLTTTMLRYLPQFALQGDKKGLEDFFGDLLSVRLVSGTLATALYIALTVVWLRDLDPLLLIIMAGTILVRTVADLFFAVFTGLNQAARGGLGETIRQWLSLLLLLPGFYLGGLRGAVLAVLCTEFIVLALGIWWTKPHLPRPYLHFNLSRCMPYLRFSLFFFVSDLLATAFAASGQALIRAVSGSYVQVAYFGVANRIYATASTTIAQLTIAFAPFLTALLAQDQPEMLQLWIERLLKFLALGGVAIVFATLFLADGLVPPVFGKAYLPVAANLVPLTLTLLVVAVTNTARLLTVVYERPRVPSIAAGLRLATFWIIGWPLIAWRGSEGACLAVLVASLAQGIYYAREMQQTLRYSALKLTWVIGLGALFLPLVRLKSSLAMNVALYGLVLAGYGGLLLLLRVITLDEIAAAWRALTSRDRTFRPTV